MVQDLSSSKVLSNLAMHLPVCKPTLTIFYQFDPWQSSIGGIQTFIRHFLKYAPDSFTVRVVGTGRPETPLGRWQTRDYDSTAIEYCPILIVENDDIRGRIPTTVKYTAALRHYNFSSDFLHFYRIEPTIVTRRWTGNKMFFVQNDLEKQLDRKLSPNAILWQAFPQGYLWLEKQLMRQFDAIYSCNTNATEFYRRRFPTLSDRIYQLNNTVDTSLFRPIEPTLQEQVRQKLIQELDLEPGTQFILFAGRLHPQKDPSLLLQAFARLNRPQTHLLIVGDGELKAQVVAEIHGLNLEGQVSLLGPVDQLRLAELHRTSSVFVLTSAYEGLPFAALEALASGVPVVTTEAGDTPRVLIPGSGLVCQEREPEAIAAALRAVLDQPAAFPQTTCLEAISPYTARTVVSEVYQQMFDHWVRTKSA
jgi:glycosyltransferase involved in cell wall biosynthesis